MTHDTFNALLNEIIDETKTVLAEKACEYAVDDDRLHNFKYAAQFEQCTPERALRGMMSKHMVSIYDMIKGIGQGKRYPLKLWRMKCGDARNYLILLEALVADRFASEGLPQEYVPMSECINGIPEGVDEISDLFEEAEEVWLP